MISPILTKIEEDVLVHILFGRTATEIGERLGKSKSTADRIGLLLNQVFDSKTRVGLIVKACQAEQWRNIILTDTSIQEEYKLKPDLTQRQLEVLQHILNDLTSKEIGALLFINARSAENARIRIMRKWEINNASQLVQVAIAKNYLRFDKFEKNAT